MIHEPSLLFVGHVSHPAGYVLS